jgi:hypothetical protein
VPPIIAGSYSPTEGNPLGRVAFLEFDSTELSADIYATFADGTQELVWNGFTFQGLYARRSSSVHVPAFNRYHFALRRVGGWPTAQVKIRIDDAGGESDPFPVLF